MQRKRRIINYEKTSCNARFLAGLILLIAAQILTEGAPYSLP